jgi:hypothetical protein
VEAFPPAVIELRIRVYEAIVAAGLRIFEPGVYDPAAEDAAEAERPPKDPHRRQGWRAKKCPRRPKPPGACAFGTCTRTPPPGQARCERCREYANRWQRENRPSRTVKPRA